MKNKIMLEIAKFCNTCASHECCPEEECILYRIEKTIVKEKNVSKSKYKKKKNKVN